MSLSIVHYNDPILRRKGEKISIFDASLRKLSSDMIETMDEAGGIGLAAQQVGKALQVCVVDVRRNDDGDTWELDGAKPPRELFMPMVLVNPEVSVPRGGSKEVVEEGCLSFPHIRGDIPRPEAIVVQFKDEYGHPHELACNGLLARCIQHEVDHLNGILFIDRMDSKSRAAIDVELKALVKKTKEEKRALGPQASDLRPRLNVRKTKS
jgi:peptide deformylase